ncbi:hypothetical protein Tco_0443361 [Tanacetum coccineum]
MTTLQFANTHNVVAFLAKPTKSEAFEQIAKTVNGDLQLQALVDGKKIIITKSIVRRDLQLEDAEVSQKLTFYKAFFSPQWKFLIYTILQCLSAKTTTWNEFSSIMASVIICLATNQKFNFSKYIFESMVKNLENVSGKFLMYPSLVKVATTASGLESEQDSGNIDKTQSKATPNESSSPGTSSSGGPRHQETMRDIIAQTRSENVSKLSNDPLLARVLALENIKTAQAQEITSLKLRFKKLEKKEGSRTHKLKRLYKVGRSARTVSSDEASLGDQEDSSKQGRKIDDIDKDAKITLVDETQGRYGDDMMFDVSDVAGEEVFVAEQGVLDSKKGDAAQVSNAATSVSTANTILVSATLITDIEITLAQAREELKSAKPTTAASTRPRAKGLVIHEQEQALTPIVSSQQPSQVKIQDKAEFDEQERIEREKARKEAEDNIALKETWDDIQAKIDDD